MLDLVDAAWADSLGCDVERVRTPGVHLVAGGPGFAGYDAVYMVRIEGTVLAYCPEALRGRAAQVLAGMSAGEAFTAATVERIAGDGSARVLGPSVHAYADDRHFRPADRPVGVPLDPADDRLATLRLACGEGDWAEAGLASGSELVYGVEDEGCLVAAGLLRPFRGMPADVGLLTHPDHRGRGLARRLASRMIADALPVAAVVRYRALRTNLPSRAIAAALGFVDRGENLVVRLG